MGNSNVLRLPPIVRPAPYKPGGVCDPSTLEGRSIPPREWFVDGLIPKGRVCLLTGNGGLGKSLLAQQLLTAAATGDDWLGLKVRSCRAFGLFCEDDNEELHRRQVDICNASFRVPADLWRMRWLSGVGQDCTLMRFNQNSGEGTATQFFEALLGFLKEFGAELAVIDTLADTFGGNEIIGAQVRTFINGCLGRICEETGATVVLVGHPSKSGLATGDGFSGNTQWHNAVRSRLYLTRPDGYGPDERVLSSMKNNYGPADASQELQWRNGAFVPRGSSIAGGNAQQDAEDVLLHCLDILARRNTNVSESKNAANYLPKIAAGMPEGSGFKVKNFERAMGALFARGEIVNEQFGPPSRPRTRIIRAPQEETG